MEYIIINDNPSLVLDHSVSIHIKLNRVAIERRRLDYFYFHVKRCKKQADVIKLTLMAAATVVFISGLVVSITQEGELLKEMLFPHVRTVETKLLNK